jgi:undecaprenyl-diphosphatase
LADQSLLVAGLLGVLEGLTEFIPVSSTGHILLAGHFLGFHSTGKAFEVLIQLGAILAILSVYFARLWDMLVKLPSDRGTQTFVAGILVAFLPAAIIGALAHGFIKEVLFETPMLICVMLILGGLVLLWVDKRTIEPKYHDASTFPLSVYFRIGLFQCLAMIPGTSRSGATIMGGMVFGLSRQAATEFSFFLSVPIMFAATGYQVVKYRDLFTAADLGPFAMGFVVSFASALVAVRALIRYVAHHDFRAFAWYRIALGAVVLAYFTR